MGRKAAERKVARPKEEPRVAGEASELASLTVPIAEAKREFSDLCARAGYARETIVVTKHGRPIAAIISMKDLERSAALEDRYAAELLEKAIATSPGTAKVQLRTR